MVIDCRDKEERMRPLPLPVPTAEQLTALENLYRKARNIREHTRAHMVLLAVEQHLTAPAIATIVREDDETVRRWLRRWMAEGIEGLKDRPGGGAPAKITKEYEAQVLANGWSWPLRLGQP